jgi:hypothetical protein
LCCAKKYWLLPKKSFKFRLTIQHPRESKGNNIASPLN